MKDIYSFKNNYEAVHVAINKLSENPNLNATEKNFVNNMKNYVIGNKGFMTEPQLKFLSDIWDKY